MAHLPLDRDVPSEDKYEPDDESPVDVPNPFREAIKKALEIAQDACRKLREEKNPKRSAIDFWCDMVDDLKRIDFDIKLVTEREIGEKDE
jgi:hypothetical protein